MTLEDRPKKSRQFGRSEGKDEEQNSSAKEGRKPASEELKSLRTEALVEGQGRAYASGGDQTHTDIKIGQVVINNHPPTKKTRIDPLAMVIRSVARKFEKHCQLQQSRIFYVICGLAVMAFCLFVGLAVAISLAGIQDNLLSYFICLVVAVFIFVIGFYLGKKYGQLSTCIHESSSLGATYLTQNILQLNEKIEEIKCKELRRILKLSTEG